MPSWHCALLPPLYPISEYLNALDWLLVRELFVTAALSKYFSNIMIKDVLIYHLIFQVHFFGYLFHWNGDQGSC